MLLNVNTIYCYSNVIIINVNILLYQLFHYLLLLVNIKFGSIQRGFVLKQSIYLLSYIFLNNQNTKIICIIYLNYY